MTDAFVVRAGVSDPSHLDPSAWPAIGRCACCGGRPSTTRNERSVSGATIAVPYCDPCSDHASFAPTRSFVGLLAAGVLGVAFSLSIPLLLPWVGRVAHAALVVAASGLPIWVASRAGRSPRAGHVAVGRAVWWRGTDCLVCAHLAWGAELARHAGCDGHVEAVSWPDAIRWAWAAPIALALTAPLVHWVTHPLVRIVNGSGRTFAVEVDGRSIASVEPVRFEDPSAGIDVRAPAGSHELRAVASDGTVLHSTRARFEPGEIHLPDERMDLDLPHALATPQTHPSLKLF